MLPFQALFVPALQQGKNLSHEFLIFHSYMIENGLMICFSQIKKQAYFIAYTKLNKEIGSQVSTFFNSWATNKQANFFLRQNMHINQTIQCLIRSRNITSSSTQDHKTIMNDIKVLWTILKGKVETWTTKIQYRYSSTESREVIKIK